ncbi:MAG: hypothetical protein EOM56_12165 [Deltaproteobacteria bacterium]|nr:hypothetical protein [Deltaproteobacteria bacterium]
MDNQNNQTITSANASLFLTVPGLYDSPVKIENYSTDAMVSAAQVNPVVAEMGVDGHLSVGYTPTPKEITITLAADSKSRPVFDDWQAYQDAAREVYVCSAQFIVPGIGKTFTGLRGALTAAQPMPNAAKTLQAPAYNITFESWTPSSL